MHITVECVQSEACCPNHKAYLHVVTSTSTPPDAQVRRPGFGQWNTLGIDVAAVAHLPGGHAVRAGWRGDVR